jgi:hypothetical protein|tara:strand:+ start:584 stop:787 length:204 start_codon:yes stop_codon:yes gene_type:complete
MKKEILKIKINNKTVRIIHEGFKLFKEQKDGLNELKVSIYDQVVFGNKTKGFIPYNNFECSIDWNIV